LTAAADGFAAGCGRIGSLILAGLTTGGLGVALAGAGFAGAETPAGAFAAEGFSAAWLVAKVRSHIAAHTITKVACFMVVFSCC
jgi:hypothetical protein